MCHASCHTFVARNLSPEEVRAKRVLEVGSRDVNGSVAPEIKAMGPGEYRGVDIEPGEGVDEVCDATEILSRFGYESFDVIISTELMEHVLDWRKVLSNMKNAVKPGGLLLITTRSRGFPFHGYPYDFWRYEESDFRVLLSDFDIQELEHDSDSSPGIFVKACKPVRFEEADLSRYKLYSILHNKRVLRVHLTHRFAATLGTACWNLVRKALSPDLRRPIRDFIRRTSRLGSGNR